MKTRKQKRCIDKIMNVLQRHAFYAIHIPSIDNETVWLGQSFSSDLSLSNNYSLQLTEAQ